MAKALRRQRFMTNAAVFLVGSVPLLHPEVQTVEDDSALRARREAPPGDSKDW